MFEKNFTDMVNISDSKVDEAPYKTMYLDKHTNGKIHQNLIKALATIVQNKD